MKARKLLSLLLSVLLLVSSMAVGTLPVLAEETEEAPIEATIPVAQISYYSSAANQLLQTTITGLTAGEVYTVSMLYKCLAATPVVLVDDVDIIRGTTVANGAAYNLSTSLLTYSFTAQDEDVKIKFDLQGSGTANGQIANLFLADALGNVIRETTGKYVDGVLKGFEEWGDNFGSYQYITFSEQPYSYFGIADPATCEHVYDNDCDTLCDACGTFRVSTGHAYDDKTDTTCNNCGEVRFVPTTLPVAKLSFYAGAANQWLTGTVEGLTAGEVYTMQMYYKCEARLPAIVVDGKTIVEGTTAMNGATYNAATGLLTYTFATRGTTKVVFRLNGSNTTTGYIAGLTIADTKGNVVHTTEATYNDDGSVKRLTGWGDQFGSHQYIAYSEQAVSFFGATDPQLCAEHKYADDCDLFCDVCGTGRTVEGHVYDDDLDAYCNTCLGLRPKAIQNTYGASMSYWGAGADQTYTLTLDSLEIGKTYTVTAWNKNTGSGAFTYNGTALVTGSTAAEGVTYDATTGRLSYTFTAADTDEDGVVNAVFKLELLGNGTESAALADMKIVDEAGNVAYKSTPRFDTATGLIYKGIEGWVGDGRYNCSNEGYQYITAVIYDPAEVGADVECAHRYEGPCDDTCEYCGVVSREKGDHVYDDEDDGTCNNCFATREGFINVATGKGWSNAATLGWVTSAIDNLTVGEEYTLSFLWKSEGTPFFYVTFDTTSISDIDFHILEGMEAINGAEIDYATGRVTYTFVAEAATLGFGVVLNSLEELGGYSMFMLADVTIVDSADNEVYRNDTTVDEARGWGWTGWSNRWNQSPYSHTFPDMRPEVFYCTHEYEDACLGTECLLCGDVREEAPGHIYDNDCDVDCNTCGTVRDIEHTYDNDCDDECNICGAIREVAGHVYDNDCDADCNSCGEIREVADHVYDNDCDADCNICGTTRTPAEHVYDDDADADCNVCGAVREVAPARTPGDVTDDGKINTKDVMYLQRYINGWDIEINVANADVTGDGKVNTKDYMFVQRYVNGWDIELV